MIFIFSFTTKVGTYYQRGQKIFPRPDNHLHRVISKKALQMLTKPNRKAYFFLIIFLVLAQSFGRNHVSKTCVSCEIVKIRTKSW